MSHELELYPSIEPYHTEMLQVSDLHTIYVEEAGNPEGEPVVFLHGGPGGGSADDYRRYFDPKRWRIILFDQRGCKRSTPFAELKENTTWDLVSDIEKIREKKGIESWHVFGGSWGSTLSLSYAISHPERAKSLILRGIFLLRKKEIQWFYQEGASRIFPDAWDRYWNAIDPVKRHDMVKAYYEVLTGDDREKKLEAARAWSVWEASTSKLVQDHDLMDGFDEDHFAEAFARIECHYFINNGFFESDNWILDNAHKLKNIPTYIVHGRYDIVCPVESAFDLKKAIPHAELYVTPTSGHSLSEKETRTKIIEITNEIVR
tara:strand:- start:17 stop:970 length:954 start_codon:yes stop_codon:yes gene_type:complete